jgi:hypothetical protein
MRLTISQLTKAAALLQERRRWLWAMKYPPPITNRIKVFLPHRRPGSFSSEKEVLPS